MIWRKIIIFVDTTRLYQIERGQEESVLAEMKTGFQIIFDNLESCWKILTAAILQIEFNALCQW